MYNPNNTKSKEVADRLSNAINNNGRVPQRPSRENTGYIGELNVINNSTVPVLLELGFFSNIDELEKICSDSYVQYISTQLANEITNIIKE
jgi:N-acetylmuramoyl-L-alanine amidase